MLFCLFNIYFKTSSPLLITDLFQDLRDGVVLLRLLEVLTGNEHVINLKNNNNNSFYFTVFLIEKRKW